MGTENPVYNLIATKGNQAVLAAGNRMDALKNGQVGVFNYHTGLSVDGTSLPDSQDFVIAVGINRTSGGTATAEDVSTSAGQVIQLRHNKSLTVKGTVNEIQQVQEVVGFSAECNKDYALKINIDSPQNYRTNGYNFIAKTYTYRTGCCSCPTCTTGDAVELAVGLVTNIANDPEKVFVATLFANKLVGTFGAASATGSIVVTVGTDVYTIPVTSGDSATVVAAKVAAYINSSTTANYVASSAVAVTTLYPKKSVSSPSTVMVLTSAGGTSVTLGTTSNTNVTLSPTADIPAFKVAYPGATPGIRVTTIPEVRYQPQGLINVKYHKTGMSFNISLVEGFVCNGSVSTTVNLQIKEGSGYDLKQLEYVAKGWGKGGPYRTNANTGLENAAESFIDPTANYNVISIGYDQFSVAGWGEHLNNLETIIAIPCADSTTLTGLFAVLDLIMGNRFGPMTNDVAAMGCSNTTITAINNPALDGIESLS